MWCYFAYLGLLVFIYYVIRILLLFSVDGDLGIIFAEKYGKKKETLRGKIIWITGASSGIGENLAIECAKYGSKLILSARRETELERVKSACLKVSMNKLSDKDVLILPMDIKDTESHQILFDKVIDYFGSLDILVNNAGRSQRAIWENIHLDVDREMFEINVFGLLNLTRTVVKYFYKRKTGHVAVTSSLAGIMPAPFSGTYTGNKHAIHGYFNSLRLESLRKNLAVTIFCPGPVSTPFLEACFTENPGQNFGEKVQPTDKRMTGERCADLYAVALANKIEESWVANSPLMLLIYFSVYYPNIRNMALSLLGPERLMKIRDSNNAMKTK